MKLFSHSLVPLGRANKHRKISSTGRKTYRLRHQTDNHTSNKTQFIIYREQSLFGGCSFLLCSRIYAIADAFLTEDNKYSPSWLRPAERLLRRPAGLYLYSLKSSIRGFLHRKTHLTITQDEIKNEIIFSFSECRKMYEITFWLSARRWITRKSYDTSDEG